MNKQIQQLTKSFANVDLDQIAQNIVNRLFSILLTIVIFFVILWAGKLIINYVFSHTKRFNMLGAHRMATFHTLTLNIYRYTCFFFLPRPVLFCV